MSEEEKTAAAEPEPTADTPAESTETPTEELPDKITLSDFLKRQVLTVIEKNTPTIDINRTVGDAYDFIKSKQIDFLPVIQDGRVVRVVTRHDIEAYQSVFALAPGQQERLSRMMSVSIKAFNVGQKLLSVRESATLEDANRILTKARIHTLPVVDEKGTLLGVVTTHAIARSLMEEC